MVSFSHSWQARHRLWPTRVGQLSSRRAASHKFETLFKKNLRNSDNDVNYFCVFDRLQIDSILGSSDPVSQVINSPVEGLQRPARRWWRWAPLSGVSRGLNQTVSFDPKPKIWHKQNRPVWPIGSINRCDQFRKFKFFEFYLSYRPTGALCCGRFVTLSRNHQKKIELFFVEHHQHVSPPIEQKTLLFVK